MLRQTEGFFVRPTIQYVWGQDVDRKTREFRFDYLTNMIDGIEKMSFVCGIFLQVEYWQRYRMLKYRIKEGPMIFIKIK